MGFSAFSQSYKPARLVRPLLLVLDLHNPTPPDRLRSADNHGSSNMAKQWRSGCIHVCLESNENSPCASATHARRYSVLETTPKRFGACKTAIDGVRSALSGIRLTKNEPVSRPVNLVNARSVLYSPEGMPRAPPGTGHLPNVEAPTVSPLTENFQPAVGIARYLEPVNNTF